MDTLTEEFPGYKTVSEFGTGGYEWAEMRVYEKDGRFFYLTDGGCSCTDWNDGRLTESDMVELPTLDSARTAYVDWLLGDAHYYTSELPKWMDVVEQFRELGLR
jgi:hypothetical protein